MRIAQLISVFALAATVLPSLLAFAGVVEVETVKWSALIGSLFWFLATPLWMGRKLPIDAAEVEI